MVKVTRPVWKGQTGKPSAHKDQLAGGLPYIRGTTQGARRGLGHRPCPSETLAGGYSSTLFPPALQFFPEIRTEFGFSNEQRWILRYGFEEHQFGKPDEDAVEKGRTSRLKYRKAARARQEIVPSVLFHIVDNTVFLRLSDVASGLPNYEEKILLSSMDSEPDTTGYSQRSTNNAVF